MLSKYAFQNGLAQIAASFASPADIAFAHTPDFGACAKALGWQIFDKSVALGTGASAKVTLHSSLDGAT